MTRTNENSRISRRSLLSTCAGAGSILAIGPTKAQPPQSNKNSENQHAIKISIKVLDNARRDGQEISARTVGRTDVLESFSIGETITDDLTASQFGIQIQGDTERIEINVGGDTIGSTELIMAGSTPMRSQEIMVDIRDRDRESKVYLHSK